MLYILLLLLTACQMVDNKDKINGVGVKKTNNKTINIVEKKTDDKTINIVEKNVQINEITSKQFITKTDAKIKEINQQNLTKETWESIITSLVEQNHNVRAAYLRYNNALGKMYLSFASIVLPESLKFRMISAPFGLDSKGNPFEKENGGRQAISISSSFGFHTFLESQTYSTQTIAALHEYHVVVAKEITDLLDDILVLTQKEQLEKLQKDNVARLDKNIHNIKARAQIGLLSAGSLYQAEAAYQAGLAKSIEVQTLIERAQKRFIDKVGRQIRPDVTELLNKDIPTKVNVHSVPEVAYLFNTYKANRNKSIAEGSKIFLPTINFSTEQSTQDFAENPKTTASIVFNIFDKKQTLNSIDANTNAKTTLERYKNTLQEYTYRQDIFYTQERSFQENLEASSKAAYSASKHADSATAKFELGFNEHGRDIISPDNMYDALGNAYEQENRLLSLKRERNKHLIKHLLEFGMLYSSNKKQIMNIHKRKKNKISNTSEKITKP